ncbi:NADPH:quinone reductase-like Zn-dependent oxidoreductase [Algoriphagus iocasae]|uniref:NADPH:quinone reductase-like Zn-dependent oxidoreductase n=1 Tax=Algoriphagus iocasae TaxID=1836499 RepID=A0A841MSY9_9BACT|nr:zinc-dependent alcohol dehydrogenase family protein [Algoriphagus iocasae]MBB6325738.1 NADPH:quinone reductase-like Zn-dependent oxidoreductase [Algoriphagus iocasae]
MKEIIFEKTGLPEEVLKLVDSPVPSPKSGEVLVQVKARNINPADLMFIQGRYGILPKLPSSAGFEASGVVEVPDDSGKFPKGTRVMFTAAGTWKDYVCIPVSSIIPIPDAMSFEIACQAFVNPMTAYCMIEKSGLKEGDWLLITAGASAFGKFAIQMAKAKGIRVACTVRHEEQKGLLTDLGADLVINSEKEKVQKIIQENTDGGVHVAFDAVSGILGAKALSSLRKGGLLMVFGALSLENIPLNSGLMIFKALRMEGFWLTDWIINADAEKRKMAFKTVFDFLLKDDSKIDIAGKFTLDQFEEALKAYHKPGRNGKILLIS